MLSEINKDRKRQQTLYITTELKKNNNKMNQYTKQIHKDTENNNRR